MDPRCATADHFLHRIPCEVVDGIHAFPPGSCCATAPASLGVSQVVKSETTGGHYGWPLAVPEEAGETAGSARGGAAADLVAIVATAGIAGGPAHVPGDSYSAIDAPRSEAVVVVPAAIDPRFR